MEVTVFNELDPIFQYNSFSANQKAIGNNFELSKLLKKNDSKPLFCQSPGTFLESMQGSAIIFPTFCSPTHLV